MYQKRAQRLREEELRQLEEQKHSVVKMKQRKWEVFPGRNTFYCGGRIVMAQRAGLFYLTLGLVVVTSSVFFVCDCPYLGQNVSPAIPVVSAVLFLFVVSNLFKTSFSDPGIIPRATRAEAMDNEKQESVDYGAGAAYRPPPRTKEILVKNQTIKLKVYRLKLIENLAGLRYGGFNLKDYPTLIYNLIYFLILLSIVSRVEYFVHHEHLTARSATIALRGLIIIAHGLAIVLEKETTDIFTFSLYLWPSTVFSFFRARLPILFY